MQTLRIGMKGDEVKALQEALFEYGYTNIVVDGDFGPKTEMFVMQFQAARNLYADGVVGPVTSKSLEITKEVTSEISNHWVPVPISPAIKDGYTKFTLRDDVADVLKKMVQELISKHGVRLTSSGSRRSLSAESGANRSSTSLHYIGRAFDLYVYSGMVDPKTDPFVITKDPERARRWIVWARTQPGLGEEMTLKGVTYDKAKKSSYPQKIVEVTGRFINFTEFAAENGFKDIPHRPSFLHATDKHNGAAEWWHFQYEIGLEKGKTTFGQELLRLYEYTQLENTGPWKYRHLKWGEGWG
jgi:peptidoglycan hydrolase-like protein with peptidoglycan-binding domain